ncbi:MAG: hypothetical protein RQ735_01175 [Flavobacteriaceae bacterium]|nr:hypothetical protein [Flavobacteriaceae bacterium]
MKKSFFFTCAAALIVIALSSFGKEESKQTLLYSHYENFPIYSDNMNLFFDCEANCGLSSCSV